LVAFSEFGGLLELPYNAPPVEAKIVSGFESLARTPSIRFSVPTRLVVASKTGSSTLFRMSIWAARWATTSNFPVRTTFANSGDVMLSS
jgi:hypothetical protein